MERMRDNYSDDETEPLYDYNRRVQEKKEWDIFEDPPVKATSASLEDFKWIDNSVVFLKIIFYILVCALVLGSAAISKSTILFATSQITPSITRPYCNKDLGRRQQFLVTLPDTERVAWIWTLAFMFFVPETIMFLRSLRIIFFKSWKVPTALEFTSYFITETLPTIGYAILVFDVLPDLDVIKGAMLMNAFCLIPACLTIFSRNPKHLNNSFKMLLDALSIIAQATALVAWPLIANDWTLFTIPLCIILISFGWWENFLSEDSPIPLIRSIAIAKKHYPNSRYFAYIFITIWKCLLFVSSMAVIIYLREDRVDFVFNLLPEAFQDHPINITEIQPIIGPTLDLSDAIATGNGTTIITNYMTPISVFLINAATSLVCYLSATFACQILIQGFSFAFPINLTVPVTLSGLIAMCGVYVKDECAFYGTIPGYLFFNTPNYYDLNDFIGRQYSWIWLIWLLSQTWVTIHAWNPCNERVSTVEKIFMKPLYDAFLVDESLVMLRRREHNYIGGNVETEGIPAAGIGEENPLVESSKDTIPRIYACGTMWHETKEEMMEFLKSIMRLDEDQSSRRIVRHYMGFDIPDYYELETHVFFDDAFLRTHQDDNDPHVNEFVLTLTSAISDAATEVHQTMVIVAPPKVTITPYGGRLTWTLPGRTKMIAHLKDKKKIRAKKRWSQVMYMYYLLGHRLMQNDLLPPDRKDTIAKHTFILALDGDIDFQPQAVQLLLDLMRKNQALGAACGRIHPIGSGPMVWYQMFEYAIGHWLQKATEHMIGCVLCSPGCFSLFRGSALMDDNVMKKYTTRSEEPRHYVQYDQGEDRWLCTLLLQRGYRVEYSAASDAYTHCPESFNEFFNQRRRWIPSTTANILDLLMDYKRTVKGNDNISQLYIMYQLILMVGTVLGPGTIFLMLVGSIVAAFQTDQWTSFYWNVVPIAIFLFVCAMFDSKIQLFCAGLLSALYGLVMMAVLIGIVLQIDNDGLLAPSSLFLFCVAMEMIVTALLHPKELYCLKYGVVYYITIPSMYMLLIIYSVFNMNNVSWGTREVTVVPKGNQNDPKQGSQPKKKEQKNKVLHFFGVDSNHDAGSIEFGLAGLFKCFFCTHKKDTVENDQLRAIQNSIEALSKKLDVIERQIITGGGAGDNFEARSSRRRTTVLEGARASRSVSQLITINEPSLTYSDSESIVMSDVEPNSWLYDGELARGEVDDLPSTEEEFWKELIEAYLQPIDDTDRKEQIAKGLKDLRDKTVVAFFMINALFVLTLFLLTLKKELLHFKWPLDVKYSFTYNSDSGEIRLSKTYLELEPLGLLFVLFFAVLLVIQFIAMLFHRFDTLSQILSTTILNFSFFKTAPEDLTADEMLERNPVEIAKTLQKLKGINDNDEKKEEEAVDRRKTAYNLAVSRGNRTNNVNDLNVAFRRRLAKFIGDPNYRGPVRRETVAAINRRRDTVVRRKSVAPPTMAPPVINGHDNPTFLEDTFDTTYDSVI